MSQDMKNKVFILHCENANPEQHWYIWLEQQLKSIGIFAPINEKSYSDDELTQLASAMALLPHVMVGYTDDESLGKAPPAPLRSAGCPAPA